MTRPEFTGTRDLKFSGWIRQQLPDSGTGYFVTDVDFILENWKTRKIMFLEVKTRSASVKLGQNILFHNIARWIAKGIDRGWEFCGYHTVVFENTFFDDGKCFFDDDEITETELMLKLASFCDHDGAGTGGLLEKAIENLQRPLVVC